MEEGQKKKINCRNEEAVIGAKNTQIKNSKSSLLEYKSKCRLSDLMNYINWLASLRDKRFAISAFVKM